MTKTIPMTFDPGDCFERCPGLVKTIEQLTRDLSESRKATESAQAAAEQEARDLRTELTRRGDRIAELALKEIHQMSAVRSLAAAQVETLNALRAVLDAIGAYDRHIDKRAALAIIKGRAARAAEVLHKYDIPFGNDAPITSAEGNGRG